MQLSQKKSAFVATKGRANCEQSRAYEPKAEARKDRPTAAVHPPDSCDRTEGETPNTTKTPTSCPSASTAGCVFIGARETNDAGSWPLRPCAATGHCPTRSQPLAVLRQSSTLAIGGSGSEGLTARKPAAASAANPKEANRYENSEARRFIDPQIRQAQCQEPSRERREASNHCQPTRFVAAGEFGSGPRCGNSSTFSAGRR